MALATLRNQIHTKVSGVTGVANVYKYRRYVRTKTNPISAVQQTVEGEKRIHWWHIIVRDKIIKCDTNRTARVYYRFHIEGFMSIKDGDGSVTEFENLADSVSESFLSDLDLGGNAFPGPHWDDGEEIGIPQVSFVEEDMDNSIALHKCIISILVSDSQLRSIST